MLPTILIVDDQPLVLDTLKKIVSRGPYTVLSAQSGIDALAVLDQQSVDVIISDERMPGMCGSELLTIIRDRYPDTVRILLTGHASLETAIRAINEGEIFRFLTKPCSSRELHDAVEAALDHKSSGKQAPAFSTIADQLERQAPGITRIKRDADGVVLIDDE